MIPEGLHGATFAAKVAPWTTLAGITAPSGNQWEARDGPVVVVGGGRSFVGLRESGLPAELCAHTTVAIGCVLIKGQGHGISSI
jgi:hypothetical protein